MQEECKTKDQNNSVLINNNNQNELLNRLKDIHCKSEERTFDLNEKFNTIKNDLQQLMDVYKNDYYNYEENDDSIDILSLEKYISDYLINERETSINNINAVFEQVTDKINEDVETKIESNDNVRNLIDQLKNEFDKLCEDSLSHANDIKLQKDDLNQKIIMQMNEQFEKIYEIINNDNMISDNNKNEYITTVQKILMDLGKKVKKEKMEK